MYESTTGIDNWTEPKIMEFYRRELRDFLSMLTRNGGKEIDVKSYCDRLYTIIDGSPDRKKLWDKVVEEETRHFRPPKVKLDLKHAKKTDVLGPVRTEKCRMCGKEFKARSPHKLWCQDCRNNASSINDY